MIKVFLLTLLVAAGCAKPNYAQAGSGNVVQGKASAQCPYQFAKSQTCFDLNWLTEPTDKNGGVFNIQFMPSDIPADKSLNVLLWMPDMGHGSSPVTVIKKSAGLYEVSKVYFIMPGQWEIRVQIKDVASIIDEVSIPISIKQ